MECRMLKLLRSFDSTYPSKEVPIDLALTNMAINFLCETWSYLSILGIGGKIGYDGVVYKETYGNKYGL